MLHFKNITKLCGIGSLLLLSSCTTLNDEINSEASAPEQQKMQPIVHEKPVQTVKRVAKEDASAENLILLAEKHYNGMGGVKKNVPKALEFFVKAAEKGSGYACRRLGLEYSDFAFDDLTPKDYTKARKWFEKGTELGDAESMFYLSEFVFEGRGGPKDEKRGTELLLLAARHKSQGAAHRAIKLANKGSITLSPEDKKDFYVLDKHLRNAIALR